MRKLSVFVALAAVCLAPALADTAPVDETPLEKGKPLFESDFSSNALLVENWRNTAGASIVDGKLRRPHGSGTWWNGRVPLEFIIEVRLTVQPAWGQKRPTDAWLGFCCDGFFCVRPQSSSLFYLAHGVVDYRALPDVKLGKPFTLTLARRKIGDQVKYSYYVNGKLMNHAVGPMPYVNAAKSRTEFKPCDFWDAGQDIEIEHLGVYLPKGNGGSANMIVNSGFEFDHEGIPPYYAFHENFDWDHRPPEEYESRYLNWVRVDTSEKHSGRQSLRIEVNNASQGIGIDPVAAGAAMSIGGRAGIFSLWMKASIVKLPVNLFYGNGRRTVTVGREWKRYEVPAVNLPAPGFFIHPIKFGVPNPGKYNCTLWVDDLQAEIVQTPQEKEDLARAERRKKAQAEAAEEGDFDLATSEDAGTDPLELDDKADVRRDKGGFEVNKSYATPYQPSDMDPAHYGPTRFPPATSPRGTTAVKTADEAALRGYELKKGETLVLSRYDYYMNETVAPFRVWDENGKLAETKLDISKLPCGTNAVTVKAHGKDWPATVVKLPFKKGATQRNFFSRSVVNEGQPILHGGLTLLSKLYHPRKDGRVPIVDWLWKKGFRSIHLATWPDRRYVPPAQAIMKNCAEIGMRVLLWTSLDGPEVDETPSDPILAARAREKAKRERKEKPLMTAQEMRDLIEMPYILSHLVIDEPDMGTPSDVARDQLLEFKKNYPYVPCQMNNIWFARGYHYADSVTDVFMLDSYLSNGEWRTVDSVVGQVDNMRLTACGKPCWYFIVGLNSHHYRHPTFGEQVAQSWGCLCAGATGLSWYIGPPSVGPCWKAIERTNREMQELKDVILSEDLIGEAGVDVGRSHLRTMTRRLKGEWYVFSAYLDWTPLEKATFTMPPDAPQDGTIEVLYEDRTLPLKDGHFSDAYKPFERHLYRVKK